MLELGTNLLHKVRSCKAVSGGAHCNPSYWGPSLSGYSGSVCGFLVLMLVNLNQHQARAEDGEVMRPSTDAGEG